MDTSQSEKSKTQETVSDKIDNNTTSNVKPINDILPIFNPDVDDVVNTNTRTNDFEIIDDDDSSFIVLGKQSMETIHALSWASYTDIQEKSLSHDYTSMVSSMNTGEVNQKLSEVLQENMKLKETLKQSNLAMKQQFSTLLLWQEEVLKVHQNHKKKFSETKEFINCLKKENAELKIKLSKKEPEIAEHDFQKIKAISESYADDIFSDEIKFHKKICSLIEELHYSKICCAKLANEVEQYKSTLNVTNTQLKEAIQILGEQEAKIKKLQLESAMDLCHNCNKASTNIVEKQKCSICPEKDKEITSMTESIALLQQKLQCALTPNQLESLSELSPNEDHQKFMQNINEYNDRLLKLSKCFVSQIDRFNVIENFLKEVMNIFEIVSMDKLHHKFEITEDNSLSLEEYREKLRDYHQRLNDEQVKIINDRETFIKSQSEFQKIFSDYKAILCKLETMIDENIKLDNLKNDVIRGGWERLEEEKKTFDQRKENLIQEKELLMRQKKELSTEWDLLYFGTRFLEQETINLKEEKASLDQQSQLYENHKQAIQDEKKSLEENYQALLSRETNACQQNEKAQELLSLSIEETKLLKTQLTVYEEDFKREKSLKESLLEEKNKLDAELEKQVKANDELKQAMQLLQRRETNHRTNDASVQHHLTIIPCPQCGSTFSNISILTEHIERCLNLN